MGDWIEMYNNFKDTKDGNMPDLKPSRFLISDESGPNFSCKKSIKKIFSREYPKFLNVELRKKTTQQIFFVLVIEKILIEYVEARSRHYQTYKCGISFSIIHNKFRQWEEYCYCYSFVMFLIDFYFSYKTLVIKV